jgi:multiple sugar transport system permease protein
MNLSTTHNSPKSLVVQSRARAKYWRRLPNQLVELVLAVVISIFILLPIFWLALTSLKTGNQVYTLDVFFQPTLDNYVTIFLAPYSDGKLLLNSILVSIVTVGIAIPIGVMAAYVFSRFHFRGSNVLMVGVLVTQFLPPLVIAIPFFALFRAIGWVDTLQALIVVYLATTLPYSIWMLKGFIDALPVEVEEAAVIDGCDEAQTLRHITIPLVMPGIITVLVMAFIGCWNEFTFAVILTRSDATTLPLGLMSTYGVRGFYWELMAATGMMIMVPMFVMSFAVRRYFVEGITMGAVK